MFQSRKALKKANFVKENVNYLVERVNDTNVQFNNLKEEISNLPPSREGTVHKINFKRKMEATVKLCRIERKVVA